jgi:transcriptional regulator with XRE-family HTH domain
MSASPTPLDRAFIAEIKAEAAAQDMTLKDLAAKAGIVYRTQHRYLDPDAKDWRSLSLRNLQSYADALSISFDTLFARARAREKQLPGV